MMTISKSDSEKNHNETFFRFFRTIPTGEIVRVEESIFDIAYCIANANSTKTRSSGVTFLTCLPVGTFHRKTDLPSQPAKSLKSKTEGVSFCRIGICNAMPYSQK